MRCPISRRLDVWCARRCSYVLAHLKHIKYLDYRLVDQQAVAQAKEQYQDELLDLEETENTQVFNNLHRRCRMS